jgi:hypothetical protein
MRLHLDKIHHLIPKVDVAHLEIHANPKSNTPAWMGMRLLPLKQSRYYASALSWNHIASEQCLSRFRGAIHDSLLIISIIISCYSFIGTW